MEQDLDLLWQEGLFVPDTNVLLNLYRYSERAKEELLGVLLGVKDSLWVPHQVALEFHRDRLGVIEKQKDAYSAVQKSVKRAHDDIVDKMGKVHRDSGIEAKNLLQKVEESFVGLIAEAEELKEEATIKSIEGSNSPDDDAIWHAVIELLDDKVGEELSPEHHRHIIDVAGPRRYEAKVPPGYMDPRKEGDRRYGDLILWFEIIAKAKESGKPILFVTDDRKEDWWQKSDKVLNSPRPELVNEMHQEAGVLLHMYKPLDFLRWAGSRVRQEISDEAAGEIQQLRSFEEGITTYDQAAESVARAHEKLRRAEEELTRAIAEHHEEVERAQADYTAQSEMAIASIEQAEMIDEWQRRAREDLLRQVEEAIRRNSDEDD